MTGGGIKTGQRQMAQSFNQVLAISGIVALAFSVSSASAYTETTLHKFCSEHACADGARPTDLVMDKSGNLFGTAQLGGNRKYDPFQQGYGTVFEYTPGTGRYQVLYKFCPQRGCSDGAQPYRAKLVVDVEGNLYGTTRYGGINGDSGVVFELVHGKSGWSEKVLWSFCSKDNCKDGGAPDAGLTYAGAATGALYDGVSPLFGTTTDGGAFASGLVFAISPKPKGSKKWVMTTLYDFCSKANCLDGGFPLAPVYVDEENNIFGTTGGGGTSSLGTVFALSYDGTSYSESVLYNFCTKANCTDGEEPETGVIIDSAGNLLGATGEGGVKDDGVLYQLSPQGNGSWQYSVLASFKGKDGRGPASLILGNDGSLFGTTSDGGKRDKGTVFQYFNGALQNIYNVCQAHKCPEGGFPFDLVQDSTGNLFGVNWIGGNKNSGTLFELVNDKPAHRAR